MYLSISDGCEPDSISNVREEDTDLREMEERLWKLKYQ